MTEHPGRAAGGKPLLHVGAFEMLAGGISGIAADRLHRYQQHRLRLPGSRRGRAVVVESRHRSTGRLAVECRRSRGGNERGRWRGLNGGSDDQRADGHHEQEDRNTIPSLTLRAFMGRGGMGGRMDGHLESLSSVFSPAFNPWPSQLARNAIEWPGRTPGNPWRSRGMGW